MSPLIARDFLCTLRDRLAEEDEVYYGGPRQHTFEGSEDVSQFIVIYYRSFFLTSDSELQIWSPGQIPVLTTNNAQK